MVCTGSSPNSVSGGGFSRGRANFFPFLVLGDYFFWGPDGFWCRRQLRYYWSTPTYAAALLQTVSTVKSESFPNHAVPWYLRCIDHGRLELVLGPCACVFNPPTRLTTGKRMYSEPQGRTHSSASICEPQQAGVPTFVSSFKATVRQH